MTLQQSIDTAMDMKRKAVLLAESELRRGRPEMAIAITKAMRKASIGLRRIMKKVKQVEALRVRAEAIYPSMRKNGKAA